MSANRSTKQNLSFFINNYPEPFSSINYSNFSQYDLLGSAAFFDFNNDYFIDFVIVQTDTGGVNLILYENDGKGEFVKKRSIPLPGENISRNPHNLKPVDFDGDGLIDLCVSFYYGQLSKPGYEIILMNTILNGFGTIDTSFVELTGGWNTQSLFADFNGDDLKDWIIANKWKTNKVVIQNKEGYNDESHKRITNLKSTETIGICATDFNNDGNLDILTLSDQYFLTLFQNDGKGFFTDVTSQVGLDKITSGDSIITYASIALADYNNDGFVDIFIADKSQKKERNYLLLNIGGNYFIDRTEEMQIQTPVLHYAIACDIDNDGDIDILSFGSNEYALWINNLNDYNYIKIKPRGVISNTDGWGAKVWIYEAGYLNNNSYLKGYHQIGAEAFGNAQNGEYIAHFGIDANKRYDVKIKFYGGKEVVLKNLEAGQTYYVDELSGIYAFLYRFPGLTLRVLQIREIQYYLITTLLTFIILILGVRWGLKKYHWDIKLSLGFVSASISIYWLLLLLTQSSESAFQKYYLPMLIAAAGILIPNIVFLWITRNQSKGRSKESISDDLFFELIQFSHGAWALSNLNSLQLLFENIKGNINNSKYIEALNERNSTFNEMVLPKLNSIINLSESIGINAELIQSLKISIKKISSFKIYECENESSELARAIITIKDSLSAIKKTIYIYYSCNPVDVIKTTCDALKNLFDENKITLSRSNFLEVTKGVLIKNYELADIIDNCLQNSVKALASTEGKEVSIKVYSLAPKIYLDIADNGSGIEENEKEKIFESGYSKGKSTGHGLYSAREVLKKYGGRIFVKSSSKKEGTVFTIELNEGILK
ncbi:MAG: VCBS repeat-containing protein, partial [Bacteroidetes bacterium]|nr:VCBS repeat-containing protein [Bacteroidota bacterium]